MAITRTQLFPLEGQSPIVLHDVPQSVELVGDITGDKGTNEIWDDTKRIEDFEVKITTLDEYSTGKPHKVIKRVDTLDTDNNEWTEGTQETIEASEKTFNLNYKGHERDFEVKVVEGGEGGGDPTPIIVSGISIYEIEPLKDEWKDASDHAFYPSVDINLECYTGVELKTMFEGLEVPSEIQDNAWYALCIDGDIPRDVLTDKNIQFTSEGYPIEGSRLTFVSSSSSSPKVQIRYRWGMNDAHDLSVEKNITITERPRPSEGGGGSDEVIPFIYYGFADGMKYLIVHKNYVYDNQYFYLGNDNYVKHSPSCAVCSFATNGVCDYRESAPEGYWDFVASHPDYVGTCIAPVDYPDTMIILEKLRDGGVYDGDEEFNENDWRKVEREEVTEGVEGVPSEPFTSIHYDGNMYLNVYRVCTPPPQTEIDFEGYYPISNENGVLLMLVGTGDEVGIYGGIYVATLASTEDGLFDANEQPVEVGTKLYYLKGGQPSLEHPVLFY